VQLEKGLADHIKNIGSRVAFLSSIIELIHI